MKIWKKRKNIHNDLNYRYTDLIELSHINDFYLKLLFYYYLVINTSKLKLTISYIFNFSRPIPVCL